MEGWEEWVIWFTPYSPDIHIDLLRNTAHLLKAEELMNAQDKLRLVKPDFRRSVALF